MILTNGDKIKLSKNYDLLNKLLGRNYRGYQKSRCKFENDCFIWMVSFTKAKGGWKNEIIDENTITETEYYKHQKQTKGSHRLVFSKENGYFVFLGLFKTDKSKSTDLTTNLIKILNKFDFEKSVDFNLKHYK